MPGRRPRTLVVAACLAALVVGACRPGEAILPTPEPTGAPTPVASSPTPEPTPGPHEAAIAAFVRRVSSGELRYRASFTGDTRGAISIIPTKGSIDVVGPNYRLVTDFTLTRPRSVERVEHRYVGGRAWIRRDGRWTRLTTFLTEWSMSPFAAIVEEADVTLLDIVRAEGDTAERYLVEVPTGFFHPLLLPFANVSTEEIRSGTLKLVIAANGVPVSGTSMLSARGRVGGQLQEILVTADLTFGAVGSKRIVVQAP
jgi:hypothetical protein